MIAGKSPYDFVIGKGSWEQEIRCFTHDLDKGFWLDFHPVSSIEVARIETETNRNGRVKSWVISQTVDALRRILGEITHTALGTMCHQENFARKDEFRSDVRL